MAKTDAQVDAEIEAELQAYHAEQRQKTLWTAISVAYLAVLAAICVGVGWFVLTYLLDSGAGSGHMNRSAAKGMFYVIVGPPAIVGFIGLAIGRVILNRFGPKGW